MGGDKIDTCVMCGAWGPKVATKADPTAKYLCPPCYQKVREEYKKLHPDEQLDIAESGLIEKKKVQ